jgi:hypothetical protein
MALTTELYWIRMLLKDLTLPLTVPLVIRCDNLGATTLASNPLYHARTKHIEVDYHFIREKVLNKDISHGFISTCGQPADIFTKGLTSSRFQLLYDKLMVCPPPIRLRGDVNQSPPYEKVAAHHAERKDELQPSFHANQQITYFHIEVPRIKQAFRPS